MTDTLRSICEQCTHLNNPQLDFIPAELQRHTEIILRDLIELTSASSLELDKAVVSLAGSILEGVLFGFLKGQERYIRERRGTQFIISEQESLQTYVNVFNRYFTDQFPQGMLPDIVVTYRDLVHMNREVSLPPEICKQASRHMLRMLDELLGQLAIAAGP